MPISEKNKRVLRVKGNPFLKWVGGKGKLLPELSRLMPRSFGTYFEPFLGSGALFFAQAPKPAYLSDINEELINCYQCVRDQPERLICLLTAHRFEKDYFEEVRAWDRDPDYRELRSPMERASRFIFLNRTCFNGLWRTNARGEFNAPMGAYKSPRIVIRKRLRLCSQWLQQTHLTQGSFMDCVAEAKAGDFIYFDPPYLPTSPTANFTQYAGEGFTFDDQLELRDLARRLVDAGVLLMLSNSFAARNLYEEDRFQIHQIKAPRSVNSDPTKRGNVKEIVVLGGYRV